ncbi:phospho-N-acetylmuramoyl-pentapeptide-transferase [Chthonomonas calidirosea]|uniref:Phospho-N-acetylmuramoyl-pentapeptide-transferase n=1 Tax=Chthonomonas calidirosea (strain DSM 23976 / ICMP 18418 / T49) TaxID=1303518 RepID=S0EY93_CHTCT|nr:phospho-N-acetylmuramoyl-pentapeptide-transferase [Chthonomonas calidirosea]CCW34791.1 Phospho-N-acetylmuramoyl-pentapeptide-transferase [Chthonomonas calidirosea T49]CEK12759.1 Phospho-N-acetylmuramoyl-pentapeptide-transferase [Chthonomonas calidirosea]CEK13785.1 Phospho-N-acetylmuramoyl-pentapeptide-transferase [Chthonomonas calidirosea]
MPRLVFAFIVTFLLSSLPGSKLIARLRAMQIGQNISEDAPQTHTKKQGTPTMGGLLIHFGLTLAMLAYIGFFQWDMHRHLIGDLKLLPLLLLTLAFGAIGFLDDYLSLKRGKNLGLRAREKFLAQCLVAALFVLWLALTSNSDINLVNIAPVQLGYYSPIALYGFYYLLCLLLIVGFSNATNFADGLDGLSAGLNLITALALAVLVYSTEPTIAFFCIALAGSLAGFLWWNAYPARVFMGDTASLAIGAGLAGAAIMGKQEVGFVVASLVCWAELVSVIVQVLVFKYRRRRRGLDYAKTHRVFLRTPLHHHFEELGWPETQVVLRFWLAGLVCAALALLWRY